MADGPAEGQCHFYLARKHRFCRFQPKAGQQYCPEHACIKGIHGDRKRIPCPLNPNHNCYEDDLHKHIKKCNVTKLQQATEQSGYFVKGINTGSKEEPDDMQNDKMCVRELTSAALAAMIEKVDRLYKEYVENIETAVFEHPCIREHFCHANNGDLDMIFKDQAALRKELLQQASLVGLLDKLGLLEDGHCFVEMGAGKGKLSHWIHQASKEKDLHSFLLVERGSVRYKMDSYHRPGGDDSRFKRIRIDIGDLCLGRVPEIQPTDSVVVIGKHLCGGATDMGIRCGMETLQLQNKQTKCSDVPHSSMSRSQLSTSSVSPSVVTEASNSSNLRSHPTTTSSETAKNKTDESGSSESNWTSKDKCSNSTENVLEVSAESNSSHTLSALQSTYEKPQSYASTSDHSKKTTISTETVLGSKESEDLQEPPHKSPKLEKEESYNKRIQLQQQVTPFIFYCQNSASIQDVLLDEFLCTCHTTYRLPAGIMIALCCHHRCTWGNYLGKDFILTCGLTPQDFDLLTRLSSWATCARVTGKPVKTKKQDTDSSGSVTEAKTAETVDEERDGEDEGKDQVEGEQEDHKVQDLVQLNSSFTGQSLREQLSVQEREEIGRKCKRLIDTGRLHYLRSKGMECFLREYVDEDLTPENVVLIAHTPRS